MSINSKEFLIQNTMCNINLFCKRGIVKSVEARSFIILSSTLFSDPFRSKRFDIIFICIL